MSTRKLSNTSSLKRLLTGAAALSLVATMAACSSSDVDGDVTAPATTDMSSDSDSGSMDSGSMDSGSMDSGSMDGHEGSMDGHEHDHSGEGDGTSSSANGFTLMAMNSSFDAGYEGELEFHIMNSDGIVKDFEVVHEKPMHLLLVSHDLTSYMHLHPEMRDDGNWVVDVKFPQDGFWRMVADFKSMGSATVLGTDLRVGEEAMKMANFTEEVRIAESGGYVAELTGSTAHEDSSPLKVRISKDGEPVAEVTPYLGASGHMVGFEQASLTFVHLHPNEGFADGTLTFTAPPMEHGFYSFFLQVDVGGELQLFNFIVEGL
jgi:hypothetical protein